MADPDDFGYEKFSRRDFGNPGQLASRRPFWRIAAVVIVILIVAAALSFFLFR